MFESERIRRYSPRATILYIVAERNHPRLVDALQCKDVWLRIPEEEYQYPVVVAYANGHKAILQGLLADSGAELVNDIVRHPGFGKHVQLRPGQDLLVWAVMNNNQSLARYLLTSQANRGLFSINSKDPRSPGGHDALWYAAFYGAISVVRLLLDSGANLNSQSGGTHPNALQTASAEGHEQVVQLLLDRGADVNARGGRIYPNALYTACAMGYDKVAQLLLDRGAEVNAPGGYFGDALQAASAKGHEKIAQILLNRGADVNAVGGYYGNALQAASAEGHEKVVQLLLHKADVNAVGENHGKKWCSCCSRTAFHA